MARWAEALDMFKKLSVQNFKAWKGTTTVDLAPLTLVLGVNSAGKSSLLQSLLLLKQTVESPDRRQALNLGGRAGDVLDLGKVEDVLAGHDMKAQLGFGLEVAPAPAFEGRSGALGEFEYWVDYGVAANGSIYTRRLFYRRGDGEAYEVERVANGSEYTILCPGPPSSAPRTARSYQPERSVSFSADAVAAMGADGPVVQDLALSLTRALTGIAYLGPLREQPRRTYPWNGQSPSQIGVKGEYAVQALIGNANTKDRELVRQVSKWLQRMDVADRLDVERQGESGLYEVVVRRGAERANLVDVGFGVSQVLPVVVLAYLVEVGTTVIMEQPEIHLHPLAQSALADLFVEVAQERHVQFLIETHSEHLFRRLQYLLAKEEITPEQCKLFFVDRGAAGAALRTLEVDEFGRVKNWPDKFFGDATGEVERQMRAVFARKKAAASGG